MIPGPSRFFTLPSGLRLHARIQGRGPWMVLVNGLLSDTTLWSGVLAGLTPHFRVLAFDGRGQGRSDPSPGPYTPADSAGDAWALLDALGVEDPWLLGLSHGSSICLEMLAARPSAAQGAVLSSSLSHADFSMRLRLAHWLDCLEKGGGLMLFDAAAPCLWGDRFLERRHGVLRAYFQAVLGAGVHEKKGEGLDELLEGLRHQIASAQTWDIRSRLGPVALRASRLLLLAGAEDLLTPPWKCLETANLLPGSRFRILAGVGHAPPVEDPKGFVSQVLAFTNAEWPSVEPSRSPRNET